MINETINRKYKKIDVLTLLHSDPKILNRLVIAFFKSKGLYEEYRAMRSPDRGKEFKDWEKGYNNGRSFDLMKDKSGRSSDILYTITIGFDGTTSYLRIGKPGRGTIEYKFSIINMSFSSFMNKIWTKVESDSKDNEITDSTKEWNPIVNAIKKKFNKFTIWPNVDEQGVRFVFSPAEINSITDDKEFRRNIRNILNPSDYSKDTTWQMRETFHEIETAATYIKNRLEKLGWYFYRYEGGGMSSSDYVVFEFHREDDSARRDAMTWDKSIEYLRDKSTRFDMLSDFQKRLMSALFGDAKVGRYLRGEK